MLELRLRRDMRGGGDVGLRRTVVGVCFRQSQGRGVRQGRVPLALFSCWWRWVYFLGPWVWNVGLCRE